MFSPLLAGKTATILSKSEVVLYKDTYTHKYVHVTVDDFVEMRTGIQ